MAPGGGIRKWDEHAERDLLLALYTSTQTVIDKDIQANVVQMMQAKGHEINWDSLRQHLQKLRRKEGGPAANNGEGAAGAASPAPKTPRKKVTTSAKSTPASSGRKRKAPKKEEDEDDEEQTPSKKVKKEESDSEGDALPPHNYHSTTI